MHDDVDLDVTFDTAEEKALISVWWTGAMLKKEANAFFAPLDSSEAQYNVLRVLRSAQNGPPMTQSDLGQRLLVDKSNITGLIDRLERQGLTVRNSVPGDRRRYHLALTPKGRKVLAKLDAAFVQRMSRAMAHLTPRECNELVALTRKLRQGVLNSRPAAAGKGAGK